jgi:glycosyltransferase involved in cell wall biosynthesis
MNPEREPRICLNMIVRNEAEIIEQCLRSLLPVIDTWVVCDTGSTDDTVHRITRFFDRHGVSGRLEHIPFIDFATTRNEALDLCRSSEEPFDYILLADADMELQVEDPGFRAGLHHSAYLVRQTNVISYYNVRLLRRDVDARYVGATHEYLSLLEPAERLEGIAFLDHAAGSSRSEKHLRDERLLLAELERDPGNARAMYYLAQTYREMGRFDEAARCYAARAEVAGWLEETWHALLCLARCQAEMGDHGSYVGTMLRAHELRPTRAEALHDLACFFRVRENYERAARYAYEASKIGYPAGDMLFVDDFANRFGGRHELSIAGFYSRDPEIRAAARRACLELAHERAAPSWCRETARANWIHYARTLESLLEGGMQTHSMELDCTKPFIPTNPSLALDGEALRAVIRTVNYRIESDGSYAWPDDDRTIRTENHLARLDRDGRLLDARPIADLDPAPRHPSPYVGHEDCRLFRWRDGWWCTATVRDRSADNRCEMSLLRLDDAGDVVESYVIRSYGAQFHQKNWLPFVNGERLLLVYSADPTIVLEYEGVGVVTEASVAQSTLALDHLRGGAGPVRAGDGWLYLTHSVVPGRSPRIYLHSFVRLSLDFVVEAVSEPFAFDRHGIEFAAGLATDPDTGETWISYGVNDREARLARFRLNDLLDAHIWLPAPEPA